MIAINLRNVDEFIFRNKLLKTKLPEFRAYFDQWGLAQQHPFLKSMGKQAAIDLLNALHEGHIGILSEHFGLPVTIDKLSNRIVRNIASSVEEIEKELNKLEVSAQVCAYREGNQVYISMWR